MISTTQAAAKLGCTPATVRAAIRRLGLDLPTIRGGLVLSEADLPRIKAEIKPTGCPKFVPGNALWKRRKNVRKSRRQRQ